MAQVRENSHKAWYRDLVRSVHFLASAFLGLCACSASKAPPEGGERGACYGNKTCNEGLSCYSEVCVVAPSTAGQQEQEVELSRLRNKLEAAEMTVARLKTLREAEERAQSDSGDGELVEPSVKDPFSKKKKRKTTSGEPSNTLRNPFDEPVRAKKTRGDPCLKNPDRPECMLD